MPQPRVTTSLLSLLPLLVACSSGSSPSSSASSSASSGGTSSGSTSGSSSGVTGTSSGSSGSSGGAASSSSSSSGAGGSSSSGSSGGGSEDGGADLDMQASDFTCILDWTKVGDYRITNKLGDESGALAVANSGDGGVFPVGTVVQLIPNEAMVKRRAGFSPSTMDWEFFNLTTSATGTVINQRGGASVTNFAGGSCANCHGAAAPQWDMICGTTHGCAPLPISEATIQSIQNGDPRCVDGG